MFVGAIDQGTTSSRFLLFDHSGNVAGSHQIEHEQIHPHAGWCEHNPVEILNNCVQCIDKVAADLGLNKDNVKEKVVAIGITNQRETTVAWDRASGKPLYNAIVWHDLRTAGIVAKFNEQGGINQFREKTGLPVSTYFSAVKMKWMIENVPAVKQAVENGTCVFGTIDSWLIYNLTGGANGGILMTEVTNASRTLLMNIRTTKWDPELCDKFGIPVSCLPEIRSSSEVYGTLQLSALSSTQIGSALGDQQAALVGHGCIRKGMCKATYGTGCFLLTNVGELSVENTVVSNSGLLVTVAYKWGEKAEAVYALEGSIASCGSSIQWLRDNLKLINNYAEIDTLAEQVQSGGGVQIVPAFAGILAPFWRPDARAVILGMSLHTKKEHIVHALLEGISHQVVDVVEAMDKDLGTQVHELRVDGGVTKSTQLLQIQANLLDRPVLKGALEEATAFGSAFAAGLAVGFWKRAEEISEILEKQGAKSWTSKMEEKHREKSRKKWLVAVERSFGLEDDDE